MSTYYRPPISFLIHHIMKLKIEDRIFATYLDF